MISGPFGGAPSAQARSRTRASADHSAATWRGAPPTSSTSTRQAVEVEQTSPNSSGWFRRVARSLTQSPPSASITTRSRSTCPRSWAPPPRPRLARRPSSPVRPSRSDSSLNRAAPTWLQMPWPSATTSNRGRDLVACTGRVTLLARDCGRETAASSLVGRVPCYLASPRSTVTRNAEASQHCRAGGADDAWGLSQLWCGRTPRIPQKIQDRDYIAGSEARLLVEASAYCRSHCACFSSSTTKMQKGCPAGSAYTRSGSSGSWERS
jgi:hypothetical protein